MRERLFETSMTLRKDQVWTAEAMSLVVDWSRAQMFRAIFDLGVQVIKDEGLSEKDLERLRMAYRSQEDLQRS